MYRDGIFSDFILKGIMFQPDVKHCPFISDRSLEYMSGACLFFQMSVSRLLYIYARGAVRMGVLQTPEFQDVK